MKYDTVWDLKHNFLDFPFHKLSTGKTSTVDVCTLPDKKQHWLKFLKEMYYYFHLIDIIKWLELTDFVCVCCFCVFSYKFPALQTLWEGQYLPLPCVTVPQNLDFMTMFFVA